MTVPAALADLVSLIDAHLDAPVLVFGSLPPAGRDLDLLARPAEHARLSSLLAETGLVRRDDTWAAFRHRTAFAVEVIPASAWRLPADELEELFEAARPIEGLTWLVRPAPGHALLIAARRLVRSGPATREKLKERVEPALVEDPSAWSTAEKHARAWSAVRSLRLLRAAHDGASISVRARASALLEQSRQQPLRVGARALAAPIPRPRRAFVVSFSGLDGAGKSSHAAALRGALESLGVRTAVVWSPLGGNPTLDLVAVPAKRVLAALSDRREDSSRGSWSGSMSDPDRTRAEGGVAARAARTSWATFVLALNALSQRRAALRRPGSPRVVIFDRYALDSVVRLRFLYGRSGEFGLQRRIARSLPPRADAAFLLEITPETAWARKSDDWSLEQLRRQADLYREEARAFPIQVVDAEAAAEAVAAEIASSVWSRLGRRPRRRGIAVVRRRQRAVS